MEFSFACKALSVDASAGKTLTFGDQKAHTNHFLKYESCVKVGLIWRLQSIFALHEDSENAALRRILAFNARIRLKQKEG